MRQYVEASKRLKDGEVIITRSDPRELKEIQHRILDELKTRLNFCPLEETERGVVAYRLSDKSQPCPPPVRAGKST